MYQTGVWVFGRFSYHVCALSDFYLEAELAQLQEVLASKEFHESVLLRSDLEIDRQSPHRCIV
eukprot:719094-Amphidinium_carterae.1